MARKKRQQEETVETPETEDVEEEVTEEIEEEKPKKKTFTSRDELIKRRYRKGVVETSLGRIFEIKSIDPKTLLITKGTAFLPAFNDFVSEASAEALQNPELLSFVTEVVMLSVTSLNLVDKEIEDCNEEEVPVGAIDMDEQIEIFSAVMDLCATEEEKREWSFFRNTTEEESTTD